MRTLFEIIESTRNGERPDYDELRYAVRALEALSTLDRMGFRSLAEAERDGKKPMLVSSAVYQYEESFRRMETALSTDPKTFIGWTNDPDNPEFQERRKASLKIVNKIMSQQNV